MHPFIYISQVSSDELFHQGHAIVTSQRPSPSPMYSRHIKSLPARYPWLHLPLSSPGSRRTPAELRAPPHSDILPAPSPATEPSLPRMSVHGAKNDMLFGRDALQGPAAVGYVQCAPILSRLSKCTHENFNNAINCMNQSMQDSAFLLHETDDSAQYEQNVAYTDWNGRLATHILL